jgi:oligopeptidase B
MSWSVAAALSVTGAEAVPGGTEPSAEQRPTRLIKHGDARVDPWYWLKEREDPAVRAYLEAENAWAAAALEPARELRERIYSELQSRVAPDDTSAPRRVAGSYYYARYEAGKEYAIHCRRRGAMTAAEEVLVDGNQLAEGHAFFSLTQPRPSTSGRFVAYGTDTVGRRRYTLRIRDTERGETLPDAIEGVTSNYVWAADDRTLFYVRQDVQTLRWDRVYRHRLGEPAAADVLVYREPDPEYSVEVARTRSDRYLTIVASQTLASEVRILEADRPDGEFRVVEPRRRGHEYALDHLDGADGGRFLLRTNDGARDFRLAWAPVGSPGRSGWREVVPARDGVLLEAAQAFAGGVALQERQGGICRLRLLDRDGRELRQVAFDETAYVAELDGDSEYAGPLRYRYGSLTTPDTVYEEPFAGGARELVHRKKVAGGYDPAGYVTERIWAPARDGARVPVTLLHRAGSPRDGRAPLLLEGYGSYGASNDPWFDATLLPLVDRGFVFAIAHVRGGQELGRAWYENGRQLSKKNTFHDFIDVAEHLQRERWADPRRTYGIGGSAGGLLIGAVANLRPDLFDGLIALVPYVDAVTTMLDPSIPLTTSEYDEWGNPNDPEAYRYIKSYSPYDNVEAKAYPNLLVTTGFHDSQVQYWEPAKWVAKLRALRTDRTRQLLFVTNFEAGHGGASGRFQKLREKALHWTFLLELANRPR